MRRKWKRMEGEEQIEKVEQRKLHGTMSQEEFCSTYSTSRGWDSLRSDLQRLCSSERSLIRTKGSCGSQGSLSPIQAGGGRNICLSQNWTIKVGAEWEESSGTRVEKCSQGSLVWRVCSRDSQGYTEYIKSAWRSREGNADIEKADIYNQKKSHSCEWKGRAFLQGPIDELRAGRLRRK